MSKNKDESIGLKLDDNEFIRNWGNRLQHASLVARDACLIGHCFGKRVLHLGCTDSPFTQGKLENGASLHLKLEPASAEIVGVDIDEIGLTMLGKFCQKSKLLCFDVESPSFVNELSATHREFDLVVCADIIEHLNNPGAMLSNLSRIMKPNSKLIVTTINALAAKLFLRALCGREAVHPDHVSYYSFATLKHLCGRFEFAVENEFQTFLYPFKSRLLTAIQPPFYSMFPNVADGIIVTAVKL